MLPTLSSDQELDFWSRIWQTEEDKCWQWLGKTNSKGFPEYYANGVIYSAMRVLYVLTRGSITPRHNVLHLCEKIDCMNPKHLIQHRSLTHEQFQDILTLGKHFSIREIQRKTGLSFTLIQKTLKEFRSE